MAELRLFRHLLAVASHPTVQAAADALFITQPALTKSIARFEEELGVKLFDRRGRKLVLTEIGERLVARGDNLLRNVREIEEEVALFKGLGLGEVGIGVDPESEIDLLPRVLEAFIPAFPNVQVTVRSGQTETLLPMLDAGDLHFLVADPEVALTRDDLEVLVLKSDSMAAAVSAGHPLARKQQPTPEDLAGYPFAGASTAPRFVQWKAQSGQDSIGRPFLPSLLCDNYEILVRLAEQSQAIVFGPKKLLDTYDQQGRIKVMPWQLGGPEVQSSLIRSRHRSLSPAAEKLIDLFKS